MVENMRPEHIDWDNAFWVVSGELMKIGIERTMPLPGRAMDILRGLNYRTTRGYVLLAQRRGTKISNSTLSHEMARLGAGVCTPYGFRSSFRDWVEYLAGAKNGLVSERDSSDDCTV